MPWLTPASPLTTSTISVEVVIPDDEYLEACFWGALMELANPENWQEYGDAGAEEVSSLFHELIRNSGR